MSMIPNKHKLYEENLRFGFYLGKGPKIYIYKNCIIYFLSFKYILYLRIL